MQATPDRMPEAAPSSGDFRFGTVLAFDFGERRIGVAVGELQLRVAHPLDNIDARANDVRFARIEALMDEWQPVLLLVGLPLSIATAGPLWHRNALGR